MSGTQRHIRFLRDWDWKPTRNSTIGYRAGQTYFVKAICAAKAIEEGVAEPVTVKAPPEALRRKGKSNG
ncbi:MAG: hypothetical protein KIS86_13455 [Devosia sp.]|nr:hypothetical protein [Devosia sp.]